MKDKKKEIRRQETIQKKLEDGGKDRCLLHEDDDDGQDMLERGVDKAIKRIVIDIPLAPIFQIESDDQEAEDGKREGVLTKWYVKRRWLVRG